MIEEYGTLSEEELIQEIVAQLENNGEIDPSDLDFKFEEDKLKITGTLQGEDELEVLLNVLEDYVDPKDYQCDVEILEEGVDAGFSKSSRLERNHDDEDYDDEDFDDDGLEEVDEDDMDMDEDEADEEEEGGGGDDEDKW